MEHTSGWIPGQFYITKNGTKAQVFSVENGRVYGHLFLGTYFIFWLWDEAGNSIPVADENLNLVAK